MIHSRGITDELKATDPKAPVQHLHSRDEEHDDLLIQGFWSQGTNAIVDMSTLLWMST
jgi:hypothetical protein